MVLKVHRFAAVGIGEGNTDWLGRAPEYFPPSLAKFALYLRRYSIGRRALTSVEPGRGTTTISPRGLLSSSDSSPTLSICFWPYGPMAAAATASAAVRQRVQAGWEGWLLKPFSVLLGK